MCDCVCALALVLNAQKTHNTHNAQNAHNAHSAQKKHKFDFFIPLQLPIVCSEPHCAPASITGNKLKHTDSYDLQHHRRHHRHLHRHHHCHHHCHRHRI